MVATHKKNNLDLWLILLLAAALRLWALDLKAPHFDEGINGWFSDKLRETGTFAYDPTNYHGPWHFYTLFLSQSLLGRNIWALRLPVVVASLLCITVIFMFARWFGRTAVRWAALAFAVSPACVFYGRYSIHEPWFVLSSMLFLWGVIALWLERDKAGLWAAAAGITGMILNKETYIIHTGSLALAAGVFALWNRVSPLQPPIERAAVRGWNRRDALLAAGTMLFLLVFFYSGNFFHFKGLTDMFRALVAWTQTGAAANGHEKTAYELLPFVNYYWLALLARYEWPALAGLIWSVRYAWPGPAVPRLLSIYAGGVLLAYSIVPYKTPWCIISILWPWFLFFGAAIAAANRAWARVIGVLLLAASLGMCLRLNLRQYENDAEPYVYVQTYRSLAVVTAPLLQAAGKDPRFYQAAGAILTDYYPLPWILGDFTQIAYHGNPDPNNGRPLPETLSANDFVVVLSANADKIREKLGPKYQEEAFRFRSAMDQCTVFFSRRVTEKDWELSP
ncbi:MAG: flippase activity-associated protein Agl23 [Chthoniobacterales bacterium]